MVIGLVVDNIQNIAFQERLAVGHDALEAYAKVGRRTCVSLASGACVLAGCGCLLHQYLAWGTTRWRRTPRRAGACVLAGTWCMVTSGDQRPLDYRPQGAPSGGTYKGWRAWPPALIDDGGLYFVHALPLATRPA